MPLWAWFLVGALAVYAMFVIALLAGGRREAARAVAGFVPDCLVLIRRLLADGRVPRGRKLLLGALVVYLASPIDLVPDMLPVVGQLDDAILMAFVLRGLVRSAGPGIVREHWPGPESALRAVLALAGERSTPTRQRTRRSPEHEQSGRTLGR